MNTGTAAGVTRQTVSRAMTITGSVISRSNVENWKGRSMNMAAKIVGTAWIRGIMPTMADADYNCQIWVSGIAENTGNRMVGIMPYAKAVEALKSGMCDSWADTGLRLPDPPDFGSDK